jgi:hypothetical protein
VAGIISFVLCPKVLSRPIRARRATERLELGRERRRRGEEKRRGC